MNWPSANSVRIPSVEVRPPVGFRMAGAGTTRPSSDSNEGKARNGRLIDFCVVFVPAIERTKRDQRLADDMKSTRNGAKNMPRMVRCLDLPAGMVNPFC